MGGEIDYNCTDTFLRKKNIFDKIKIRFIIIKRLVFSVQEIELFLKQDYYECIILKKSVSCR